MPNWVWNNVTVTGDADAVARFAEQASKPYVTNHKVMTEDGEFTNVEREVSEPLSFWNFVRPDDSILDEYYGDGDNSRSLEEKLQFKTNHWYDWNIRNWGCKWDASEAFCAQALNDLHYEFDTPWSPPVAWFESAVAQYPELNFTLTYVEEQGWGGEWEGLNGGVMHTKEWDIPESHDDSIDALGRCRCEEMSDDEIEYMFDDCPRKVEADADNERAGAGAS